jgi:site-specific DNA recombinase
MSNHHLRVAIYARVSSEQQAKEDTIASQLEALAQRLVADAVECDPDMRFVDDGYTGSTLIRPGLERLRDQAAAGVIDRLYVLDPDRFSRKICLSSFDSRRTHTMRRRGRVSMQPYRP